jgi:hypothetical protein
MASRDPPSSGEVGSLHHTFWPWARGIVCFTFFVISIMQVSILSEKKAAAFMDDGRLKFYNDCGPLLWNWSNFDRLG